MAANRHLHVGQRLWPNGCGACCLLYTVDRAYGVQLLDAALLDVDAAEHTLAASGGESVVREHIDPNASNFSIQIMLYMSQVRLIRKCFLLL